MNLVGALARAASEVEFVSEQSGGGMFVEMLSKIANMFDRISDFLPLVEFVIMDPIDV